jgi:signal transduction histidine kinase
VGDGVWPEPIARCLLRVARETSRPAFLQLDATGVVRGAGGSLAAFGLAHLRPGDTAASVSTLAGLVPPGPHPVAVTHVESSGSVPADVHVFEEAGATWVLFLDASGSAERDRAAQQAEYEQRLRQPRTSRETERPGVPGSRPMLDASVLGQLGFAVLEPAGGGTRLRLIGKPPPWFETVWPEAGTAPDLRLEDRSAFLEYFLTDARDCWAGNGAGVRHSGLWTELDPGGREWSLRATALRLGDRGLLLLEDARTLEAERGRLLQAAREQALRHQALEREVEKRDVLLRHVVHDLRSPMVSVASALELLRFEELPARARELIDASLAQTERQDMLIRSILDLFAGELRGLRREDAVPVNVRDAALAVQTMFEPLCVFRHVRLAVEAAGPADSVWALAHRNRLERVLANLVDNAVRHSPEGGTVTLCLRRDGDGVRTSVEDRGRGIPPELVGRVFELGRQGSADAGIAGLGLHFCRTAVTAWGGTITAENREDGGARFAFWLPAAPARPDHSHLGERT